MNFFLLLNTKEDILKNVRNQKVDGPIDFHGVPNSKYFVISTPMDKTFFLQICCLVKFFHVFIIAAVQTSLFL